MSSLTVRASLPYPLLILSPQLNLLITHISNESTHSIWKYIHKHLIDEYDFFLLGGDDMFYLVEPLRSYLNSPEIQNIVTDPTSSGLYLGRRFFPKKQLGFNSGGAGYVLDIKALQVLGKNIDTPKCWPHQKGFWEDVNVGSCLRASTQHLLPPGALPPQPPTGAEPRHTIPERASLPGHGQIEPHDTRDASKRERWHPFTPGNMFDYQPPSNGKDWFVDYTPELKLGEECCSTEVSPPWHRSGTFLQFSCDLFSPILSILYHLYIHNGLYNELKTPFGDAIY